MSNARQRSEKRRRPSGKPRRIARSKRKLRRSVGATSIAEKLSVRMRRLLRRLARGGNSCSERLGRVRARSCAVVSDSDGFF